MDQPTSDKLESEQHPSPIHKFITAVLILVPALLVGFLLGSYQQNYKNVDIFSLAGILNTKSDLTPEPSGYESQKYTQISPQPSMTPVPHWRLEVSNITNDITPVPSQNYSTYYLETNKPQIVVRDNLIFLYGSVLSPGSKEKKAVWRIDQFKHKASVIFQPEAYYVVRKMQIIDDNIYIVVAVDTFRTDTPDDKNISEAITRLPSLSVHSLSFSDTPSDLLLYTSPVIKGSAPTIGNFQKRGSKIFYESLWGDACSGGGSIMVLDKAKQQLLPVVEVREGCGIDGTAHVGYDLEGNIILSTQKGSKEKITEWTYTNLYSISSGDPQKRTMLITEENMPRDIHGIFFDEKNQLVYLNSNILGVDDGNLPVYQFNLADSGIVLSDSTKINALIKKQQQVMIERNGPPNLAEIKLQSGYRLTYE